MAYIVANKPDERVRKIRLQVDTEWVSHDFGGKIERHEARELLLRWVDAILPPPITGDPA